jgi:glycosyltransferase involved in cell wall biosynthesis
VVKPDVVHIHGTEYAHGNDYVAACGGNNVVVSIQGLVGVIASYYLGGLQKRDILRNLTLRDILRKSTIYNNREDFVRRGEIEENTLKMVKHVIGRTEWDNAHVWAVNPTANYYHCGETLRDSFYCHKWSYETCIPHTIFLSQSEYPIKGLQIVLAALPLVLKEFPDTKVYVAGHDLTNQSPWYRYTGYAKFISNLIKKLGLKEYVIFTGSLNEEEICQRYLNSNLFICSSIIENSPNSLGEAQVLGVPVLASYAGGIPGMMSGNESNLYRFDDAELLAYKICNIFKKKEKAAPLDSLRKSALLRHSSKKNLDELLDIYKNRILNIEK